LTTIRDSAGHIIDERDLSEATFDAFIDEAIDVFKE